MINFFKLKSILIKTVKSCSNFQLAKKTLYNDNNIKKYSVNKIFYKTLFSKNNEKHNSVDVILKAKENLNEIQVLINSNNFNLKVLYETIRIQNSQIFSYIKPNELHQDSQIIKSIRSVFEMFFEKMLMENLTNESQLYYFLILINQIVLKYDYFFQIESKLSNTEQSINFKLRRFFNYKLNFLYEKDSNKLAILNHVIFNNLIVASYNLNSYKEDKSPYKEEMLIIWRKNFKALNFNISKFNLEEVKGILLIISKFEILNEERQEFLRYFNSDLVYLLLI